VKPLLTEAQIREGILQVNAEATWEQQQETDLQDRRQKCCDRQRTALAQFQALRTMLREWYGKDVGKTAFPFTVEDGEIPF
jgi:hypothetical protein